MDKKVRRAYENELVRRVLEALQEYIEDGPDVEDHFAKVTMDDRVKDFGIYLQYLEGTGE